MTESQERFEEWVKAHYEEPFLKKLAFNRYVVQEIQNLWEAWQALNGYFPESDEKDTQ